MAIGHVSGGIDPDRVMSLYEAFWGLYNSSACRRCWAVRFCANCNVDCSRATGRIDTTLQEQDCAATRDYWRQHLVNYCSILEENSGAFDYLLTRRLAGITVPELAELGTMPD